MAVASTGAGTTKAAPHLLLSPEECAVFQKICRLLQEAQRTQQTATPPAEQAPATPVPPERDFAAEIAAMRERREKERKRELAALRQETADAEARVKAASAFVVSARLQWPIIHLLEEMYYWPSWLNNPCHETSARAARLGFLDATGSAEKSAESEERIISKRFNGTDYGLRFPGDFPQRGLRWQLRPCPQPRHLLISLGGLGGDLDRSRRASSLASPSIAFRRRAGYSPRRASVK